LRKISGGWIWQSQPYTLGLSQVIMKGPHDQTHVASMMLAANIPLAYISKMLGHSSIQTTVDTLNPPSRCKVQELSGW